MFGSNQRFICIYNKTTSKHYLLDIKLRPLLVDPLTSEITQKRVYPLGQFNQESSFAGPLIKDHLTESQSDKMIDFSSVFQQIDVQTNVLQEKYGTKLYKEIFVPQLNRYCEFSQLSHQENCVPLECAEGAILLLRLEQKQITITNIPQRLSTQTSRLSSYLLPTTQTVPRQSQPQNTSSQIKFQLTNLNKQVQKILPETTKQQTKDRDRSRTIGQVMNYVRRWRDLAENGASGMRLNLQEAAVRVGVPKKSLDDYYYQLRVGQKYQFDFDLNLNKNISVLRRFVKQKIPSRHKNQSKINKNDLSSHEKYSQQHQQFQKIPKKLKQYSKIIVPKSTPIYKLSHLPVQTQPAMTTNAPSTENDDQNRSIGELSNKYKLSESEVSSIPFAWPKIDVQNGDPIYDDEDDDIFFNDFKNGNDVIYNGAFRGNF